MAASSPVKFLFNFLLICVALWLVFILVSRLLALILSRIVGASVDFRVGGWKCLRDVVVKFKKGSVESIAVGEIKVSLRQSLVKLGVAFISRDPKLQILISDLEIVMRPSVKSIRKAKTRKKRSSGRGKWMIVVNLARFLSVYVTDFVLKTPKATIEVKELKVDMSKNGGSKSDLFVKLHILPILIHVGEPRVSCDQPISFSSGIGTEKSNPPFSCEELSLSCQFSHAREVGVVIKNVDINTGEVSVNLDEELLVKKKSSSDVFSQTDKATASNIHSDAAEKPEKKQPLAAVTKNIVMFPEKVCFNMPKLDVRFHHREYDLFAENNIMGIQFKSTKSQSNEEMGESTRLDIQLELSEIHIIRESGTSVLEILKVGVVSFVYIPLLPSSPVRAEIDVRLGGTQCNLIVGRLKPWLDVHFLKKKRMVLREEYSKPTSAERPTTTESNAIMWTCTVSAPEMTIVLYSIIGVPLYHVGSQSSHAFANNISSAGTAVHMELGELNLHMADEYQECLKESLFGVESNSGSLVHIAKVSLDWGKKDIEGIEEDGLKNKLALSVDVTGMGVYFNFRRVESLISTAISFQSLLKKLSSGKKTQHSHGGRSSKSSGKGTRLLRFNLERCSVNFCGDTGLENTVIADPKRVNYGSQGGRVVISTSADGTPRSANIMSTLSAGCKKVKYSVSFDIFHLSLCVNKEKQFTQIELERARSDYQEYVDELKPCTKVALFDMQNSKFVRRSGGHKEIAVCSLFSATDITIRWEPDVHLSLFELLLRLKSAIYKQRLQGVGNEYTKEVYSMTDVEHKKEALSDSGRSFKHRKRESIFAVDVEMLTVYADAGDGVNATVQVQSIFSENARIGVLLEGLMLSFNGSRVLKSSRMQISRIPSASSGSSGPNAPIKTVWDWVIQGLDIHICMPYRLQLRAIDDSIEEMLRVLKLVAAAKSNIYFPMKKESSKPKKPSSTMIGTVRFSIRRLTADIEEEPIQGWLDEHYQLMKNEACDLAVRMKFLDDILSRCSESPRCAETGDCADKRTFTYNGSEFDLQDHSAIARLREEIYKQAFRSYYQACQKLTPSEGSGACKAGFQSRFRPSVSRTSLLSISATELDVSLKRIDGGESGMIEVLKRLDPICRENNIPFSRLYGCNIMLHTGSLVAQLRNYTFPLLSGTSGKCEGCIVLAQQATCFQPQIYQDVYIGRWRKVRILRSASGTTPPMKTYMDLPLYFQKAEVSFGVGYEPAFADVSYAFTVALRRANLSVKGGDVLQNQPPKKERSLPWWDEVRNYIHGNISLIFSKSRFVILATTDPYEKLDKLQITSDCMEINQSDGRVHVSTKNFKLLSSSLESLVKNRSLKLPSGTPYAFLEVPFFTVEVTMDWDCESGNPLNHYLYALPNEGKSREKVYDPFRSTSLSLRWNLTLRPFSSFGGRQYSSAMGEGNFVDETVSSVSNSEDDPLPVPTLNIGHHDLAWVIKFWNLNYFPPYKLRTFARWPRFGVPRVPRSGNLSLDKVMTEFMLRIDAAPTCIKHMPLDVDDPAKGLIFNMSKLKYELCNSRGKQKYTFDCKRDALDLVYQGLDLHTPKAFLNGEECASVAKIVQMMRKNSESASMDRVPSEKGNHMSGGTEKNRDDGFLLSCDYFTIRRQSPKADPARLLVWQEAGRRNPEMTYVRSEFENGSESDEHTRSDPSDDDGYNVVIADNCQRIFVYGLKLLWTTANRDAVWSWVSGISKAFEPPKPSPSRQYAQRKLLEEKQIHSGTELLQDAGNKPSSSSHGASSSSPLIAENSGSLSSPLDSSKIENLSSSIMESVNMNINDSEEEGTRHFMVNIIEPQFNLHSQGAHGRFLLAAVSGRVLARSFHSVLHVGYNMIEQALGSGNLNIPEYQPQMTWKRMEFSAMLEHVQAHVAPTDVDPGAAIQWLPKIRKSSPKVKRTGALLERVFMPCDMYFRYTRHKGGTSDLKVKPLKELTFNSHNIKAAMTARQYNVLMDVLSNLLFARLPKPRKSTLSYLLEDDDDDVEGLETK